MQLPMRLSAKVRQARRAKIVARASLLAFLLGALAPFAAFAQDAPPPISVAAPVAEARPVGTDTKPEPASDVAAEATKADLPPSGAKNQHDLTPMSMFLAADPIVQGVMVLLSAASVATWTIFLMKGIGVLLAKRRMRTSIAAIHTAASLTDASVSVGPGVARRLLSETEREMALSHGLPSEGIKDRVEIALQRIEAASARSMAVGIGVLATIGSIGPFVGLFGTVWGIMRSFIGIAQSNTTNLAVVAPGIAEALLATGIGLVAAIPAVVIYNALTRSICAYRIMTGDAVALILRHLSRELDRREFGSFALKRDDARLAAE